MIVVPHTGTTRRSGAGTPASIPTIGPQTVTALTPGSSALVTHAPGLAEVVDPWAESRAIVGCIVPAHNSESTIAAALESLLGQTRLPDSIHVVASGSTDRTVEIAGLYAGPHAREENGVAHSTEVYVHDLGATRGGRVDALNYGYALVEASDYLLCADADTIAEPDAVAHLVAEISSDTRIGGISAIPGIDGGAGRTAVAGFVLAGQRAQLATSIAQTRLRGRNTAVLGRQFTVLSTAAIRQAMSLTHQSSPWVSDTELEGSLLSLQLTSAGFLTKVSAEGRAEVGAKTTLRTLDAQQVRRGRGAIELMWPGRRGDTMGRPFHPGLRPSWRENVSLAVSGVTRVLFVGLLLASFSIGVSPFHPLWLVPPAVAALLGVRRALALDRPRAGDVLFAATLAPAELYTWVRLGHFVRAWSTFLARRPTDSWTEHRPPVHRQGNGYLAPVLCAVLGGGVLAFAWFELDPQTRAAVLAVGWAVLGALVAARTLTMGLALLRPWPRRSV
jgi:hypothetical protein